jgi:hypothetical protein
MLLVLSIFITILVWLGFLNADSVPVAVPPESQALAEELAASLKDTAIPAFVLTYGIVDLICSLLSCAIVRCC